MVVRRASEIKAIHSRSISKVSDNNGGELVATSWGLLGEVNDLRTSERELLGTGEIQFISLLRDRSNNLVLFKTVFCCY